MLCILPGTLQIVDNLSKMAGDIDEEAGLLTYLEDAHRNAEWVQKEAQSEFPLLHAHSVVGLWSALEVLCEDFAIAWLKNMLAAWMIPDVARLRIPLATFHQFSEDDKLRYVVSELSRSQGGDLRKGVGKLKSLLQVFGLNPPIGPNLQRALHELCHIRNVFVHCGGIADQRFVTECPWLSIGPGERVLVSHALYGWYHFAAKRYAERVSNQVFVALGFPGCKCPGLDEIAPRPDVSEALQWGTPP